MRKNYFRVAKRFASAAFLTTVFGLATFASKNPSPNKSKMNPIMDPADFVTFTITGLNADVVANGVGAAADVTTNDIDNTGYCFLETGYQSASYGLPVGGLISSPNTTDLSFQLASYDADNSLRIPASGDVDSSITFAETGSYETIYFAATSGSGPSTFSGTIDFQDGTTQAFSGLSVADWYGGSNYIISGIGRVSIPDNALEPNSSNPRIYELSVDVDPANQSKTVTGITVTNVTAGGTSANITLNIFAVSGKLAPTCIGAGELSATPTSTTEATVSWDMLSASSWEVAYTLEGDPAPTSGEVTDTNSFDFSDLEVATTYTAYVRVDCGSDNYSEWSTVNFTTLCGILSGIDEDFESSTNIPTCWSVINGGDGNTWVLETSDWTFEAHSGTNLISITYSSQAHNDYFITPAFTVTEHESDIISFWAKNYSSFYVDEFDVLVSTTGNSEADFTDTLATNVAPGTTYTEYSYNLSDYVGQTIYFAIKATSTNEFYIFLDDFLTSGTPYCDAPSDLDAMVTPSSATLSWSGPSEDGYEIAVQDTGAGEPTSGMVVSENSYEAALNYGEIKEFYVRTICTGGGYSPWSGPFTFGSYTTLETSGYTDDVIANGVGASASSTTNDIDGGNFAYFSKDFDPTGSNLVSVGLPLNGVLNSPNTSGLSFELQSYGDNNSLRMPTASEGGTLTVTNAYPAETLYLSVVSGGGSGSMSGTIHFNDGSTQAIPTTAVSDWYNGGNYVIAGIGRVNTTNDNVETPNNNPRIYEMAVALEEGNYTKTITSIDFQKETGGVINVFAASIKFSEEAGLSVNEQTLVNVTMYPNPVKDQLFVKGMDVQSVDVFTVLGQRVAVDFNENAINVSNLCQGVYFVTVNSVQGSKTFRIIKQ